MNEVLKILNLTLSNFLRLVFIDDSDYCEIRNIYNL